MTGTSSPRSPADGPVSGVVSSLLEDREGNLWVGTQGFGVHRFIGKPFTSISFSGPPHKAYTVLEDRDGKLWFGGEDGLVRYDADLLMPEEVIADPVACAFKDRSGDLWFGTASGALHYADGELRPVAGPLQRHMNRQIQAIFQDHVIAIGQDRDGQMWFGTANGAIRDVGEGGIAIYSTAEGLTNNGVTAIELGSSGDLWFGTDGGVSRFDSEGFTNYTTADGLAHNIVRAIMADDGTMWFGTDGGVSQFDGEIFQNLLRTDGLNTIGVRSILKDGRGYVWMAHGGISRYRPSRAPPPVYITDVIADKPYGAVDAVSFSASTDYLAFEFLGLSFRTRSQAMIYRYRLRGYDDWHNTREHRVEYVDLPTGEYTFEVVAVDRDLNYSATPAAVAVRIRSPYEQIAWMAGLVVCGMLIALQAGRILAGNRQLRSSNQQLQEKTTALEKANLEVLQASQAKSAFLANMSHQLRSPMNSIVNFSSLILDDMYGEVSGY